MHLHAQELEAEVQGIEDGKERTRKLQRLFRQKDEQVTRACLLISAASGGWNRVES